jgi:mannose-6-phosphate isomerase-like protein (cupin superfamily)
MHVVDVRDSAGEFRILQTTALSQLAVMRLVQGGATSEKPSVHPRSDQTVMLLEGGLTAEIGGEVGELGPGEAVVVPAGVPHRFLQRGSGTALAFTVYSPPAYSEDED